MEVLVVHVYIYVCVCVTGSGKRDQFAQISLLSYSKKIMLTKTTSK